MPPDDLLTDDYVAELLAKDAADCSLKYSAMGLDAYNKSAKRPANQPKPNTRFLNNIIRDTTSHNRALRAKETAESQARLRDLEGAEEEKRRAEQQRLKKQRPGPGDIRKRMLGDIAAFIGGPPKRRKVDEHKDAEPESKLEKVKECDRSVNSMGTERGVKGKENRRDTSPQPKGRNSRKELFTERDGRRIHTYRKRDHTERSRSRDGTQVSSRSNSPKSRKEDQHREHRHRSSIVDSDRRRSRRRSGDRFDDKPSRHSVAEKRLSAKPPTYANATSDSDPLEDVIGPKPPSLVRRRGRGATANSSGINNRFASDYDPKTDVSLEDDDDWDTALEAVRDRQKWKEQGADRLRAAGFTDDDIKKWEKGGKRSEEDVRWSKKGEQREWDRGKAEMFKNAWKEVEDNGGR